MNLFERILWPQVLRNYFAPVWILGYEHSHRCAWGWYNFDIRISNAASENGFCVMCFELFPLCGILLFQSCLSVLLSREISTEVLLLCQKCQSVILAKWGERSFRDRVVFVKTRHCASVQVNSLKLWLTHTLQRVWHVKLTALQISC